MRQKIISVGILVSAASLFINVATNAATSNWNVDAAGNWNTDSNWTAAHPNAVDDVAGLTFNITTANRIVTLDGPNTIGTLNIGDPALGGADTVYRAYTVSGANTLTFDVTSGSAAINKAAGSVLSGAVFGVSDTVSTPIQLNDNLLVTLAPLCGNITLSGIISGNASITRVGNNTIGTRLILGNAANAYTGDTIIGVGGGATDGGTLRSTVPGSIPFGPGKGNVVIGPVGIFELINATNTTLNINGLTGVAGSIVDLGVNGTNSTLAVGNNDVTSTYAGIIRNTATGTSFFNLLKVGSGTQTLSGASTYNGTTRVNGGTLKLDFVNVGSSSGVLLASSGLRLAGGELSVLGKSTGTSAQTMASLQLLGGDSKITLNGNGGSDTTLSIASPTVIVGNGSVVDISTIGTSHLSLATANTNGILGAYATFGGNSWARNDGTANNFIEALPNASYLTTTAAGNSAANYAADSNVTVTSSPILDAPVIINSLRFNNAAASTVSLTGSNFVSSGGILVTSAVGNNLSKTSGGTIAGNTVFTSSTGLMVVQNNTARELEIASDIVDNGAASTLNKSGPGTLKLSGTGNAYTGSTFISGGTLKLGGSDIIPDASRVDFPKNTGVLDLAGFSDTIDALSAEGGVITSSGVGTSILTTGGSANSTYAGSIQNGSGTLALVKAGSNVLTMAGNSTYTGGTTLNSGTLRVSTSAALGTGPVTLNGGVLDSGATVSIANNIAVSSSTTTNVVSTTGELTLTGAITGDGTIQNNGTANQITRIRGKINGFSGTFDYNAVTNGNSLYFDGTDPDNQNGSNAKFVVNGVSTRSLRFGSAGGVFKMGELSGSGGTIRNEFSSAQSLEIGHLNSVSTYSGIITNGVNEPLTIVKVGTGALTLGGANSYTGDTKVQSGTLSISQVSLADAADVYLNTGALLDLGFGGPDTIDQFFINAVAQATGTWGSIGSGAQHETAFITGLGQLLVSTATLLGDYNNDGKVNAADYVLWRKSPNSFGGPAGYNTWRANFGAPPGAGSSLGGSAAVPEPTAAGLLLLVALGAIGGRWSRFNRAA